MKESDWRARAADHEALVGPYIDAYRYRRSSRRKHPVHDFLFEYYQTNRTALRNWRPAAHQFLQGASASVFLEDDRYAVGENGVGLDPRRIDEKTLGRLRWARSLLTAAQGRVPRFNCFGLHEWAMVYKAEDVRHETTPLRLSRAEIEEVVEAGAIRCSHYDAFRFFTHAARPLNDAALGPDDRERNEQFGCVHFNMDLYRWSYKASPWVGSDLMGECFRLALRARELDMRASPYDLTEYGYDPIPIETQQGKERYVSEQQSIFLHGQSLAERLVQELQFVIEGSAS